MKATQTPKNNNATKISLFVKKDIVAALESATPTSGEIQLEIFETAEGLKLYLNEDMVNTVTGCGGWFHNFGGLSTPINMWAKAYYCPGRVNTGFDTYLEKSVFNEDNTKAEIDFTYYGENEKFNILCVSIII